MRDLAEEASDRLSRTRQAVKGSQPLSESGICSIHYAHPFPAKLPVPVARWAITEFSRVGDIVLDPMAGCGTVLVESRLLGRNAVGVEIDPVARLIASAKSSQLDPQRLETTIGRIRRWLQCEACSHLREDGFPRERALRWPEFPNRDYWFRADVMNDLAVLKQRLARASRDPSIRRVLWLAYSSLIISDKASVGNMRDVAHSRAHFAAHDEKPDVFTRMDAKLARVASAIGDFAGKADPASRALVLAGDARRLPVGDETIDLVCTSPPYLDGIDYGRALKFSAFWLADVLGVSPASYLARTKTYIGAATSQRGKQPSPADLCGWGSVVANLSTASPGRERVVAQYVLDMSQVVSEIARVLRPGGAAVVVVGRPRVAGLTLASDAMLRRLARKAGLSCDGMQRRPIDERRRSLPMTGSGLEGRMREEYVLVLRKRRIPHVRGRG